MDKNKIEEKSNIINIKDYLLKEENKMEKELHKQIEEVKKAEKEIQDKLHEEKTMLKNKLYKELNNLNNNSSNNTYTKFPLSDQKTIELQIAQKELENSRLNLEKNELLIKNIILQTHADMGKSTQEYGLNIEADGKLYLVNIKEYNEYIDKQK